VLDRHAQQQSFGTAEIAEMNPESLAWQSEGCLTGVLRDRYSSASFIWGTARSLGSSLYRVTAYRHGAPRRV